MGFGEKLCAELKTLAKLPTDYKADKKCTVSTTCATAKTSSSFTMLGLTDAQAKDAKIKIQGTAAADLGTALKAALDSDDTTKGGTKTDPTETVAPVTIADDTEAKSDMETHVVYSLKEAAECEKVKKSTKTSKFVEKLCASIKTFGSLDDTVAKTCTVSTTCDTKTATTAVKHTGLKQADAITAMSAILKKTLAEFKTDLEAAKNADDALKAITVSEPTSVVVKLTDAASSSTDKTDKDKDKTTD